MSLPESEVLVSDNRFGVPENTIHSAQPMDAASAQRTTPRTEQLARNLNNQGMWFVSSGRPLVAVRCFERACDAWPMLSGAWVNLAATLTMLGQPHEAGQVIDRATSLGALTRQAARRSRVCAAGTGVAEKIIANRHCLKRPPVEQPPLSRPSERRVTSGRRPASVYLLLWSAAYDLNCAGKIPAL